jgi:ribosome-binding ATPase YchF (GTP1/OBG family)
VPRLEKEVRGKKVAASVLEAARAAEAVLAEGTPLSAAVAAGRLDPSGLKELGLLTTKPFIYVFNVDADALGDSAEAAGRRAELAALVAPAEAIFLDAQLESELAGLDDDDAAELLAESGQDEPGLHQLARVGFATLGLQTYLTAGPKESRAWTIKQGATAPEAAGVIHTDFQRGFIKAEVVSFEDLVAAGSMSEAKARGRARIEGKEYVMADGDVVEFRFNV